MGFLKGLLWLLGLIAVLAVAVYLTGTPALSDRFTTVFLNLQSRLPITLNFEQFLLVLTIASLLLVGLTGLVCAGILFWFSLRHRRKLNEAVAAQQKTDYVLEEHRGQYEQLLTMGRVLSKQLDKRMLVQHIVESASRMASVPQANSIVSLWRLHFESDTIRFERGLYCDEAMFRKTEFQLNEPPFSHIVTTQQPWIAPTPEEGLVFLKREKAKQLGATTSLMLVPLVIENSVLGALAIFCHPDLVTRYQDQAPFYNAVWSQLTLAMAVAVQAEVAILDRLTAVLNREYFMKRFLEELERANRYQLPLSLLMVDIDNFKLVNDMLGHPQGDAVLKIIARLIKKSVRAIDLVGRYGGEEFIILLPETGRSEEGAQISGAAVVAERMRLAVDDEFRGLQKPLNLTVSIGVMCRRFPEDRAMEYRDLIRIADEQLYKAKTSGKNKICLFQPEKPQGAA